MFGAGLAVGLVIGLVVGCTLGILVMGAMRAGSERDDAMGRG